MAKIRLTSNPKVRDVFEAYPDSVREKIQGLRNLILEAAEEIEDLNELEETLKWGEPSYLAKKGSTIRIDWKEKQPNQYAMYFKCTSKLVETFRSVYEDTFAFEGKRAIVFQLDENVPKKELKACIRAGLTYHKVKHLPLLGM